MTVAHASVEAGTRSEARADQNDWLPLGLESYEPSSFGYTKNSDDVSFESLKLSVKFPILPRFTRRRWHDADQIFLSFTGYWGFYIGTRPSGPVVGKEYNPQIFWQHNLYCHRNSDGKYRPVPMYGGTSQPLDTDRNCYFSIGYNHDSNGQTIDAPSQYLAAQREHGTEAANDAISRRWDYILITGRYIPYWTRTDRITVYPIFKLFLNYGARELHPWEHPADGKARREVDGLGMLVKFKHQVAGFDGKVALRYATGYRHAFKFNTVRLELGIVVLELPIVFWAQKGYMSDLSQYYRNVTGYGVELEIGAFSHTWRRGPGIATGDDRRGGLPPRRTARLRQRP